MKNIPPKKIFLTPKAELEELFLRKKPVRLLRAIKTLSTPGVKQKYISILSKETDCTYSHTVKLLEAFRSLGLVEFDKIGRVKYIKLTLDGEELASHFDAVLKKFSKLQPKTDLKEQPKPQQVPMKPSQQPTSKIKQ